MKTNYLYISLVLLLGLACSCSHQVTSLNSSVQLQTVSLPTVKPVLTQSGAYANPSAAESIKRVAASSEEPTQVSVENRPASSLKKETRFQKIVKKGAETVASVALMQPVDMTFLQKHTTDRGYPQINKAGFIFVAAGILGFLLKLIPIACWICIGIGLIVLLSPLLHKRY